MIIPIHLAFDLIFYSLLNNFINVDLTDLILLFSNSLFDLDHLFSKPIYHPKRDPFKTHFLHKKWQTVLMVAIIILFFRRIMFLGIGLISHLFLDYIDVIKINLKKKRKNNN